MESSKLITLPPEILASILRYFSQDFQELIALNPYDIRNGTIYPRFHSPERAGFFQTRADDRRNLFNLCLTCQTLRAHAEWFLYRNILLSAPDDVLRLLCTLLERPGLHIHVASLVIAAKKEYDEWPEWCNDKLRADIGNQIYYKSLVHAVRGLLDVPQSVDPSSTMSSSEEDSDDDEPLSMTTLEALTILLCRLTELRHLVWLDVWVGNMDENIPPQLSKAIRYKFLPNLHTLELRVTERPDLFVRVANYIDHFFLLPSVRTLNMGSDLSPLPLANYPETTTFPFTKISFQCYEAMLYMRRRNPYWECDGLRELCRRCPKLSFLSFGRTEFEEPSYITNCLISRADSLENLCVTASESFNRIDLDDYTQPTRLTGLAQLAKLEVLCTDMTTLFGGPYKFGYKSLGRVLPQTLRRLHIRNDWAYNYGDEKVLISKVLEPALHSLLEACPATFPYLKLVSVTFGHYFGPSTWEMVNLFGQKGIGFVAKDRHGHVIKSSWVREEQYRFGLEDSSKLQIPWSNWML